MPSSHTPGSKLFCKLTRRVLNRDEAEVEAHMRVRLSRLVPCRVCLTLTQGRRFRAAASAGGWGGRSLRSSPEFPF